MQAAIGGWQEAGSSKLAYGSTINCIILTVSATFVALSWMAPTKKPSLIMLFFG
jgi:hypothetical protein